MLVQRKSNEYAIRKLLLHELKIEEKYYYYYYMDMWHHSTLTNFREKFLGDTLLDLREIELYSIRV